MRRGCRRFSEFSDAYRQYTKASIPTRHLSTRRIKQSAVAIMKAGARRSPEACVGCHDRKVRCDYFVSGAPCTNCRLDYRECVGRAKRKRRSSQPEASNRISIARAVAPVRSDTAYTAYSFIDKIERSALPVEDFLFLQIKGCLNVPLPKYLRLFVEAYFAHVHPLLPLLNEAKFPRIKATGDRQAGTISLFVLQSMLFASCSFVQAATIREAGFTDASHARDTFYRRAAVSFFPFCAARHIRFYKLTRGIQLLYYLGAEPRLLPKAQGAVLLSYRLSPSDWRGGSQWLLIAAQTTAIIDSDQAGRGKVPVSEADCKIRLWWSISLRDQAIALSRREPLQTIPAALESRMQSLDQARLDDEIEQSIIYLPSTKRVLGHLFQLQCQLSRLLARVIPLAFGDVAHRHQRDPSLTVQSDIGYLKLDLAVWDMNRKTMVDQTLRNSCVDRIVHIHTHILSIYYHHARVSLCHRELALTQSFPTAPDRDLQRRRTVILELHHAAGAITHAIADLDRAGAGSELPHDIIALAALPFMLRVLNLKLASISISSTDIKEVTELLSIFTQPYFQRAPELADFMRDIIKQVTESAIARIRCLERSMADLQSWGKLLLHFPQIYLQAVASLDKALSCGYYREEEEPPGSAPSQPLSSPLSTSDPWSWMGCISSETDRTETHRSWNLPSPISLIEEVPHATSRERKFLAQAPMTPHCGSNLEAAISTAVGGIHEDVYEDSWAGSWFDLFLAGDAQL
ncbi:hypothetical protein BDV12DRAFT_64317 [Aspergillus spectabilis]